MEYILLSGCLRALRKASKQGRSLIVLKNIFQRLGRKDPFALFQDQVRVGIVNFGFPFTGHGGRISAQEVLEKY